jgi:hypothetical protein
MNIKLIVTTTSIAMGLVLSLASTPASAYRLQKPNGEPCAKDGTECQVYCENKHLAGSMNWNGTVWTDGVKSDPDRDAEAKKIVEADGTACT